MEIWSVLGATTDPVQALVNSHIFLLISRGNHTQIFAVKLDNAMSRTVFWPHGLADITKRQAAGTCVLCKH